MQINFSSQKLTIELNFLFYTNVRENERFSLSFSTLCRKISKVCSYCLELRFQNNTLSPAMMSPSKFDLLQQKNGAEKIV